MKKLIFSLAVMLLGVLPSVAREPQRGYRGFVDYTFTAERYKWDDTYMNVTFNENSYHHGVAFTNGYQFNSHLFVGAGLEFNYSELEGSMYLPLYAAVRGDMKIGRVSTFASLRVGSLFDSGCVAYTNPSIGVRLPIYRKLAVNVGVGFNLKWTKYDSYSFYYDPDSGYASVSSNGSYYKTKIAPTVSVGIEF